MTELLTRPAAAELRASGPVGAFTVTPSLSDDGREMRITLSGLRSAPGDLVITTRLLEGPDTGFDRALSANHAALAALPFAIRQKQPMHVAGECCPVLLGNLEAVSQYWGFWSKANDAAATRITAEAVRLRDGYDPTRPHVLTLSGGVDSTTALLRTGDPASGWQHRPIGAAVCVRGFDYPVGPSAGWDGLVARLRAITGEVGTDLVLLETDIRSRLRRNSSGLSWKMSHALCLGHCLALLEGPYAGGLFAADYTYLQDGTMRRWGSNAVTNRMMSSQAFPIEPRGYDLGRTEKVAALHRAGLLRLAGVCFDEKRDSSENCGRCSKCRRTMLNCRAKGLDARPAFPRNAHLGDILGVSVAKPTQREFFRDLLGSWEAPMTGARMALRLRLALYPLERTLDEARVLVLDRLARRRRASGARPGRVSSAPR